MSNFTKERVQEVIRDHGKIGSTGIELAVANSINLNKGLLLNLNGVEVANMAWFYPDSGSAEEMVYIRVDNNNNYDFFFKENDGTSLVVISLDRVTVFEKLLETLHKQYGRDVGLEIVMHYEVGTMLVIPDRKMLTAEEFLSVFKEVLTFQSIYLNKQMMLLENETDKQNNLMVRNYGKEFVDEVLLFNIPLWVEVTDDVDVFRRYKTKILNNVMEDVEKRLLNMEAQEDKGSNSILQMAKLVYPKTQYKIPIPYRRSKVVLGLADWVYLPAMTFDFLGIRSLLELVDKYLY